MFCRTLQPPRPTGYQFVPFDDALRLAAESEKPIFLYFGRHGCTWCDKTNKESLSDPNLRRRYSDHYVLVYVDAESGRRLTLPSGERITEADLGPRFRIFATPVFLFMTSDGTPIAKIPGIRTIKEFLTYDEYIYGGHYKSQTLSEYLDESS